jgi:hypothetical protein
MDQNFLGVETPQKCRESRHRSVKYSVRTLVTKIGVKCNDLKVGHNMGIELFDK